jgi:hypothetical protein
MLAFTKLKKVLQNSKEKSKAGIIVASNKPTEGLKEQKRKRRTSKEADRPDAAKKQGAVVQQTRIAAAPQVAAQPTPTRNIFAPLRDLEIEETTENNGAKEGARNSQGNRPERPPPIIIIAQLSLLRLQGEIKASTKGSFELRNARNGTRVVTKEMADYLAIKKLLEKKKTPFYTFQPKSVKPIKVVIRHLLGNIPVENITKELQALGFTVISVRQLTSKRPQAPVNLALFLITLPRSGKSQDIFQFTSLSHVIVKVEAYRAQTGLTQCYNCQQFGYIWANCK